MKIKVINTEGLTKFESTLVRLVNGCSFDRRFLDGESGKYAAKKLFDIAVEEYKQSLWKPADSDDLPEIDREVIALVLKFGHYKVVFAHRVDENAEVHTSIDGKPLVLHPMRYDKGGWNQSDVKWWLDLELPKMEE